MINLSLGSTRDPSDPSVDGFSRVEQRRDRVRRPARSARRRGGRERQRRAAEALALGELPGRLPARARRRGLRAPRRRAELLEPRRPARRPDRARDGHLLALPAPADRAVLRLHRAGLLELRHEGLPPRRRHLVLVAAGRGRRGAAVRRGGRAAPRPGERDPEADRLRRDRPPTAAPSAARARTRSAASAASTSSAALDALQGPPPPPDRFEPNDDAGSQAAIVYHSLAATATLDWWDDPNDVYRIHLVKGPAAVGARARRPEESTRRSTSGSRGSSRSPTPAPTCARAARSTARACPSGSASRRTARPGTTLQVKLARPGFGPYRIHLTF